MQDFYAVPIVSPKLNVSGAATSTVIRTNVAAADAAAEIAQDRLWLCMDD